MARRMLVARPWWPSSAPDRFTEILSGGRPATCQAWTWAQAARSTHRSKRRTRPRSSARGMNWTGPSRPWVGCCQRTSASAPTTAPEEEVDLRLVEDPELVALEGVAQVHLQAHPGVRDRAHARRVQAPGTPALVLGRQGRGCSAAGGCCT